LAHRCGPFKRRPRSLRAAAVDLIGALLGRHHRGVDLDVINAWPMDGLFPTLHSLERRWDRFDSPSRIPTRDEHIGWAADANEEERESGELSSAVTEDVERLAVGVVMPDVDDNADSGLAEHARDS
jgi:hypothetical protein